MLALLLLASLQHSPGAAILAEFDRVPLVAFCEHHRSQEVHDVLSQLIAQPEFGKKVDDIVVEFGNALYQPIVDRYVAGGAVSVDELRSAWRDTGQWLVWDSPLYERFFLHVRARNASSPPEERVRVLLGDPPMPWAGTRTADEYRRFQEREVPYVEVVRKEVLARGHRALLVMGGVHFMRAGPLGLSAPKTSPGVAELLEKSHPKQLHVVWSFFGSEELARSLGFDHAPAYQSLAGSSRAKQSFASLAPQGLMVQVVVDGQQEWKPMGTMTWPPMADVVDSLLYLGPKNTTVDPDPAIYLDSAYQGELRRRAQILQAVHGLDFLPELDALVVAASKRK